MNTNMKLDLKFDATALLGFLAKYGPTIVALSLVGLFGYTGWVVNQAFNVQPAATADAAPAKVVFDKATIEAVKNLRVVPGQVAPGDVGKSDPFTP